ncbi:GntR family transcriptional regulator [Aliiruegeria lutimaris]|uniref:Transcriptional regulator, GntR family n=1 Tax=Aliiruegeria lutimaris TaxID=571298 RepID=A0A1G9GNC9_9RHOB|nr:GntR family transcriptional regulator [Aliiruegeria lutimaris]SDL01773.1 transcriptional regulator, GntR family [Aliiruegeria lutimaris]
MTLMKNGTSERSPESMTNEVSATHKAYLALRRMIVVGELQPGEKLKIDRLRNVLDTGASPVREALSLLTSDLLVERLDQRGFRAADTSHENFVEILTLRCELEEMALRQSISNADEEWEDALVLAHHKMVRQQPTDLEAFEARHKDFHMALLANCRSPILMKFCSQLYDLNIRYRYLAGKALNYQKRDVASEHAAILEAALDRDANLASERLLNHYRQTGAFLNGLFSQTDQD